MINVDIANIWGQVSLGDMLELESRLFSAHSKLAQDTEKGKNLTSWMQLPEKKLSELILLSERICLDSDVLVVIGDSGATLGAQAVIELLQGPHRNLGLGRSNPQILFAGDNLSTLDYNQLTRLLAGRSFSLLVIAGTTLSREAAIALRSLRWRLDRKSGTDYGRDRIFVVTDPKEGPLRQLVEAEGWENYELPTGTDPLCALLSPAGLLPMAVAGIDVKALLKGAREAVDAFNLLSFDNPAWLYTTARHLLHASGQQQEFLGSFEPGFCAMGRWWQQLFSRTGPVPFPIRLPGEQALPEQLQRQHPRSFFETLIRFDGPDRELIINRNVFDPEGLNALADQSLDQVQKACFDALVEEHADLDIPLVSVECGQLSEQTLGQLIWFFLLSRALSQGLQTEARSD